MVRALPLKVPVDLPASQTEWCGIIPTAPMKTASLQTTKKQLLFVARQKDMDDAS